jgi:sulfur-oxidizing protein SoxZ
VSQFGKAWVRVSEGAKPGQPVEIRAMIIHPMESGFRLDNVGRTIPRHIVTTFTCTYGGKEVFRATLHPAMSGNPYFVFSVLASQSADLLFTWTDDRGGVATHIARLEVTG